MLTLIWFWLQDALLSGLLCVGLSCIPATIAPPLQSLFEPAAASPIGVGRGPVDIAVGDMNRDGKLDFLSANSGSNNVSVMLGDGRGGFREAPGSPFDAGPKPHLIVLGDFNADRAPDAAVTEHDSHEVRLFLNDGAARFIPGPRVAALTGGQPHNHGLSAADVNGDGHVDLATSNQNHASVSVLLGNGRGGFTPAPGSPFAVGRDPYPHALADVNGDAKLDIVSPNIRGASISVLFGDGRGGFAPASGSPVAVNDRPYYTVVADVNADGKADILATHDDISLVSVLLGDGRGNFRAAAGTPFDAGFRGWKFALADLNDDAKLDLAISGGSNLAVFLGDGTGRFAAAPGETYRTPAGTWGVTLSDVNGDRKLDILACSFESNNVTVLLAK